MVGCVASHGIPLYLPDDHTINEFKKILKHTNICDLVPSNQIYPKCEVTMQNDAYPVNTLYGDMDGFVGYLKQLPYIIDLNRAESHRKYNENIINVAMHIRYINAMPTIVCHRSKLALKKPTNLSTQKAHYDLLVETANKICTLKLGAPSSQPLERFKMLEIIVDYLAQFARFQPSNQTIRIILGWIRSNPIHPMTANHILVCLIRAGLFDLTDTVYVRFFTKLLATKQTAEFLQQIRRLLNGYVASSPHCIDPPVAGAIDVYRGVCYLLDLRVSFTLREFLVAHRSNIIRYEMFDKLFPMIRQNIQWIDGQWIDGQGLADWLKNQRIACLFADAWDADHCAYLKKCKSLATYQTDA